MASIVQEWEAPSEAAPVDSSVYNQVRQQVLENGIERPKGYTVSFHYNSDVEQHHFGRSHPMKPWRLHLTKQLILSYGLHYSMDLYRTHPASKGELADFHNEEYLEFLRRVTPDNMLHYQPLMTKFNFGDDCPVFDGLYEYCTNYTGATMSAARNLTSGQSDIAINWSGGLHHAKKAEASGFCYVNDIVLAILELLRIHPRVLYIDIDVHHGDGVEQAFASTDRVLTLSFHKYDPDSFFPGTGGLKENGPENPRNPGAHHSLNVPLKDGIDDVEYMSLFEDITGPTVETFQPTAIVLQCGADSLGGDRLGKFNLNIKAHGFCVDFVRRYNLPLLLLGGGGYTARNVARLWCHETSLCVGAQLNDELPMHVPYRQAFTGVEKGNGLLYPSLHDVEPRHLNEHPPGYLESLVKGIRAQLRYLQGAPSVQMQRIPSEVWRLREQLEREMKEEKEDDDVVRQDREANYGGRGELLTY